MITTTDTKVIIEFEHPCPAEVIKDLQEALILSLQHVHYTKTIDLEELQRSNYFVLELLKQTL